MCAFSNVSCLLGQCEVSCVVYTSLVTFNVWLKKTIVRCSFHRKHFQDSQNSVINTTDLTLKKMFDISAKLVGEQDEIFNVDTIRKENHGNICH